MAKIFFSYVHDEENFKRVSRVKTALEQRGHDVWLDHSDIQVGGSIPQAVHIGLGSCDFLAVFLTKNAEKSHWVKKEIATFIMRDTHEKIDRILPLKFERCRITDFSCLLDDLRWADFTDDSNFDNAIDEVIRRIESTPISSNLFSRDDFERLLFSIDIAIRAGNATMMFYNSSLKDNISLSDRKNAATEADRTAQLRVTTSIQSDHRYARDRIIGEEEPFCYSKVDTAGYTWVIDPLDGTNNFINRIPVFCSAIGVLKQGKPFIGVLYDPVSNEVHYGMNGQQSQVWRLSSGESSYVTVDSTTTEARKALLATHISSRDDVAAEMFRDGLLFRLSKKFKHIRMLGCGQLALAWVATGRLHAFFQMDTHLWDQVAGLVLLQNSGGIARDITKPDGIWTYESRSVVACNNETILKSIMEEFPNTSVGNDSAAVEQVHGD